MKFFAITPILLALLLTVTFSQPCLAHKVRIFAWEEAGEVRTESKFSGGRAAQNVTVSVLDIATGEQLLSGRTDEKGLFSFPLPESEARELEIIVDGGDGHKNSWKHTLQGSSPVHSSPLPSTESATKKHTQPGDGVSSLKEPVTPSVDAEELTRVIEEVLERKLGPIRKTLAENSESGPTLQDILGGIGYIFGLAGIAAYMQSRKKKED